MSTENMSCTTYERRPGTSGIRGQLYETKLISLIYFRVTHDDSIEEFHLASNVDKVGRFDDICFKAKVKGFDRPLAVFIQAKQRKNNKRPLKIDLAKYFKSYLEIRHTFDSNSKDVLFKGNFEKTECLFVIHTNANDDFENDLFDTSLASKLNDLIGTGGTAKQPYITEQDIKFLSKVAMKEEIISLAGRMAMFICGEGDFQMLMNDELVLRYHVILAQKVIEISEIQPGGYRIASFRQDFFNTNEEFLILLKDALYMEIVKKRKLSDTDIHTLLTAFLQEPSDVKLLSKLIGTVLRYKNGQLEFDNKVLSEDFKRKLNVEYVSQLTVNKAVELAAKEILSSLEFKVPTAFGNKDLTISGDDNKIVKRLKYLTFKILHLLHMSAPNNIVTIDDSLENGLLQLNGGIAGAVGNILVPDENTKFMKFTDNFELLGDRAKTLLVELKSQIDDLHRYKFYLNFKKCPKLFFDYSEYEENLARDFLNKLLLYTNQADENGMENILKIALEIKGNLPNDNNNFKVRNDAIFLNYHNEIQKWWSKPKRASYLTKSNKMFESAVKIFKDPLMSILNQTYKITHNNYTFNENALRSSKLQDQHLRTIIVTENSTATVSKVIQYLENKNHVVLDIEYISNLRTEDRNLLCTELENTNNEKILIFVCDKIQNSNNGKETLENLTEAILNKKSIFIINPVSVNVAKKYFEPADIIYDENNNLIDMTEESQKSVLATARVIFQGKEVSLEFIEDYVSKAYVEGDVFNKLISKEPIIEIGKPIGDSYYDKMKHLYVDRCVKKMDVDEDYEDENDINNIGIETLHDIVDDVVLVTAKPGMGKSSLLTHLSLKTKELDPKVWIVRINLLEYSREFNKWKKDKTEINSLETLNFMCRVILREKLGKENEVKVELEEANDVVHLKDCTGDQWTVFELKLFLHFYNRRRLIFLFDGFDEICPHYTNEVIECLKTVSKYSRKHRMWITSRSYNEVKSILQREFGTSYQLKNFSRNDTDKYLEKFWKSNLIIKEFDRKQFENVHDFLEFLSEAEKCQPQKFEFPFNYIYINASNFLINEIKNTYAPFWKYNINKFVKCFKKVFFHMAHFQTNGRDGTPLHMYIMADYIVNKLKVVDEENNNWNLDNNTFTIHERFLETKLKKIRNQEKNIMISYEKERTESIKKHKKIAAYAIFHQYSHIFFNTEELKELKDTIKLIEKAGDKTGLIHSVANDIPIFVHMTITEYLAVEYAWDIVKSENCIETQKSRMDCIKKVMVPHIREIFDYKLKENKKVIFE